MTLDTIQENLEKRARVEAKRRVDMALTSLNSAGFNWVNTIQIGEMKYQSYTVQDAIARAMVEAAYHLVLREMTEELLATVERLREITGQVNEMQD